MRSAIAVLTYRRLNALKETLSGLSTWCSQYPLAVFEDAGQRDATSRWLVEGAEPLMERYDLEATEYDITRLPNSKIKAFLGNRNLGVTGNTNRALKWFLDETDADHLCLLNDDLHILGNFVDYYAKGHKDLGIGLFCFCDFTQETYRWVTVRSRGYRVKLLPRYTGIMMSLTRKLVEKIGYYDARFKKFGEEHCTTGDSLVWMGNYQFKPISEVKVGDEVIGWRVRSDQVKRSDAKNVAAWRTRELCKTTITHVGKHRMPVVKVLFESGASVTCTEDHLWASYSDRRRYNAKFYDFYCPEIGRKLTRVVTPHVSEINDEYRHGYIKGALDGDGSYRSNEVVLRVQNEDFTARFREFASKFYEISTSSTHNSLLVSRILGGNKVFKDLIHWQPSTDDEWRGWLGGIYDAEGHGRSIGQSKTVNPDVCANIYAALNRFGFGHYTQDHQICIKGGRTELLRFWVLASPVCSYKMDSKMLCGRFKKADTIKAIVHAGVADVYGLKTTSGNYIVGGYASKNCDYTIRARFAGGICLDGQDQHCLDLEHDLLKHQEVETSVTGEERNQADKEASEVMAEVINSYRLEHYYKPFCLQLPRFVGATENSGIPIANLKGYRIVHACS